MTPFLISVVGVSPVLAVGTDLVYNAATKIVGAWLHSRQGPLTSDWRGGSRSAAFLPVLRRSR